MEQDLHEVRLLSVNWDSTADAADGGFSMLIVTDDGERHVVTPGPAAAATLIQLAQATSVLFWDTQRGVLISGAVGAL